VDLSALGGLFMERMPDRYRVFLICVVLTLVAFIVFEPVCRNEFIGFDDSTYVTRNPHVRAGLTRDSIVWSFGFKTNSYWHPLTWLSHMLDCQLYELRAGWHHLTNLVLHISNSVLLFLVLKRMTAALWRSLFVALLFALHPVNVDSVAWVAERKNILSTLFWMLTILTYVFYSERPGSSRYLLVILFFAMGLLAKPMLITLPFVLILLDYWPLGRLRFTPTHNGSNGKNSNAKISNHEGIPILSLLLEKIPFLALSVVSIYLSYLPLQRRERVISTEAVLITLRIANALVSYVGYIKKMFWPRDLAIFYPYPDVIPVWQTMGALVLLLCVSVLLMWVLRSKRYLTVGWLWFIGTSIPVIGLVQAGLWPAMADRWMYVPFIGLFILISWGCADILTRWRYRRIALGASAMTILLALAVCTRLQLRHWRNSVTIFSHALAVAGENSPMHNNLGLALQLQGSVEEAINHYHRALELDPNHAEAHNNLGDALRLQGNLNQAISHYYQALKAKPNFAEAHNNLGNALLSQGKTDQAMSHFRRALQVKPDYAKAHNNLANILLSQGNVDEAIEHYHQALKIEPDNVDIRGNLEAAIKFKLQRSSH
jgi:tetratricopeptide (TPR) repeat protein